jgi:hypothetical protein
MSEPIWNKFLTATRKGRWRALCLTQGSLSLRWLRRIIGSRIVSLSLHLCQRAKRTLSWSKLFERWDGGSKGRDTSSKKRHLLASQKPPTCFEIC